MLKDKNLYYVGGVVRDEFLGIKSFDTDFCYEGDAISFAKENGLKILKENNAFGTVKVNIGGSEIDIASTRTETYDKKGHLPKIQKMGCSLKEDLKRRDFTINAMAKRTTDGELIDYYGGQEDIGKKVLRVLHKESFIDDPTRIIRGLKFSVRFDYVLSEKTKELQESYLQNVNYDMSYHRLKKELMSAFNLNRAEVFDRFKEQKMYKLLGANIKEPEVNGSDIKRIADNCNTEHVWLFYLFPFIEESTLLPMTRAEKRILEWSNRLRTQEPENNTPKESIIMIELVKNV